MFDVKSRQESLLSGHASQRMQRMMPTRMAMQVQTTIEMNHVDHWQWPGHTPDQWSTQSSKKRQSSELKQWREEDILNFFGSSESKPRRLKLSSVYIKFQELSKFVKGVAPSKIRISTQ